MNKSNPDLDLDCSLHQANCIENVRMSPSGGMHTGFPSPSSSIFVLKTAVIDGFHMHCDDPCLRNASTNQANMSILCLPCAPLPVNDQWEEGVEQAHLHFHHQKVAERQRRQSHRYASRLRQLQFGLLLWRSRLSMRVPSSPSPVPATSKSYGSSRPCATGLWSRPLFAKKWRAPQYSSIGKSCNEMWRKCPANRLTRK